MRFEAKMGFQKNTKILIRIKKVSRYLLGLLCSQMFGCGCTKKLIPNLLMLDAFQIKFVTPPVLTHVTIPLSFEDLL
jgi:hypothetical protein